jgi:hypothetical protein
MEGWRGRKARRDRVTARSRVMGRKVERGRIMGRNAGEAELWEGMLGHGVDC